MMATMRHWRLHVGSACGMLAVEDLNYPRRSRGFAHQRDSARNSCARSGLQQEVLKQCGGRHRSGSRSLRGDPRCTGLGTSDARTNIWRSWAQRQQRHGFQCTGGVTP